jgi:hypothetical protein
MSAPQPTAAPAPTGVPTQVQAPAAPPAKVEKKNLGYYAKKYWYITLIILGIIVFAIWYYCFKNNEIGSGNGSSNAPSIGAATTPPITGEGLIGGSKPYKIFKVRE